MAQELDYKTISKREGWGSEGTFGLHIQVGGTMVPKDWEGEEVRTAVWKAAELLEDAIKRAWVKENPEYIARGKETREKILACFPGQVYVDEIPNEYSPQYYKALDPWFVVTTPKGRIKIGWRKRVMEIDWTDTVSPFPFGKQKAQELFPDENVTKGEYYIHAYGYEKAKEYIKKILESTDAS